MNKLITDRPSDWKDWIIEQIEEIESELDSNHSQLHSIGIVILPENIRGDNALTTFYNAGYIDRVIMSQHLHFDAIDRFMESNIDKYVDKTEIVFNADTSNDENGEDDYSENEC